MGGFFSNNIRLIREVIGIKQDAFEEIGIKKGTYSNYEIGKTEPNIDTLMNISKFLGVDLNNLISVDLSILPTSELLKLINDKKNNANLDANLNANLLNKNRKVKGEVLEENTPMVSEPAAQYERSDSSSRDNGLTELIRDLVDQLKEQSEEIGALRQENAALKHRLAQIAEDVGNVSSVPA